MAAVNRVVSAWPVSVRCHGPTGGWVLSDPGQGMTRKQLCERRWFAGDAPSCHKIVVSHFSAELAALIQREFEGSQLKFGRVTGIDQSMVSRQCAGVSLPDRATIGRVTRALPESQSIPLVVAYLLDHCPVSLRTRVRVQAGARGAQQRATEGLRIDLGRLTTRQRDLIRQLADLVVADPGASDLLSAFLKFVHASGLGQADRG